MKRSNENELLQAALRRKLTDEEEAELQSYFLTNPEAQADFEEEAGLNRLLDQVPQAPISSNFTAQVMQRVERERRSGAVHAGRSKWWRSLILGGWLPRTAVAASLLLVSILSVQFYEHSYREELVRNVAAVSSVMGVIAPDAGNAGSGKAAQPELLPSVEVLENFDAIQSLSQVPQKVDFELLAALQQ